MRRLAATVFGALFAAGGVAAAAGLDVAIGKAVFDRIWVGGGASTQSADGLGPLHNARSCAGCHQGGGSASIRLNEKDELVSPGLVVRLADGDGRGDPRYGDQIQTRGLPGQAAEAAVVFALIGTPAGGMEPGPRVDARLAGLSHGPVSVQAGVRQAPTLRGRAAFDRVDVEAVLALADPDDADGDGISGRPHVLADGTTIGRYGWRADGPTLAHQVAAAFAVDLGLSTAAFPDPAGDCTGAQPDCRDARHGAAGGAVEVGADLTAAVAAYLGSLRARPPAETTGAADGAAVFAAAGCGACHVPALPTAAGAAVPAYTDLLLHDMGAGLADPAAPAGVSPAEWRTAPLIDVAGRRAATRRYLHDGRAGTLDEAIRWHGGEAAAAAGAYRELSVEEREALLKFLETL